MKKNNNVFWIGLNSFFTDMSSEMIKPLIPIYLKVVLNTPVWIISLFNSLSEFLANIFKIIFWIKSDNEKNKKKLILIWYAVSNLFKPFIFIIQSIYWLFFIELLNRIWKWIRTAPKEVIMTYSIKENELWKWFWFQKSMDSLGAFVWTLIISFLLFIFWLEYSVSFLWINLNLFYIIMILALIPWLISFQIILKKIRNVYINDDELNKIKEKRRKKMLINLTDVFNLWKKYNLLLVYIILLSIWNVALIFFILELINKNFLPYQITLFYAIYTLIDWLFSYSVWKLSDKKGTTKFILFSSLFFIFISLLLTATIGIDKTFIGILVWIFVFWLLWMYEASFEGTFKKVIVENVEQNKVWTAMWVYMWISWIIKILIGLVFAIAWMNGKTDAVFWFWFLFIFLSIMYLYILYKYKLITIK